MIWHPFFPFIFIIFREKPTINRSSYLFTERLLVSAVTKGRGSNISSIDSSIRSFARSRATPLRCWRVITLKRDYVAQLSLRQIIVICQDKWVVAVCRVIEGTSILFPPFLIATRLRTVIRKQLEVVFAKSMITSSRRNVSFLFFRSLIKSILGDFLKPARPSFVPREQRGDYKIPRKHRALCIHLDTRIFARNVAKGGE